MTRAELPLYKSISLDRHRYIWCFVITMIVICRSNDILQAQVKDEYTLLVRGLNHFSEPEERELFAMTYGVIIGQITTGIGVILSQTELQIRYKGQLIHQEFNKVTFAWEDFDAILARLIQLEIKFENQAEGDDMINSVLNPAAQTD